MASLHWLALLLVIIGAVNWGLVGLLQLDLVAAIFGEGTPLSRLIYTLVGIAGVVVAFTSAAVTSPRRTARAV